MNNLDKYAVIGNPVKHSLSPLIFKLFSSQTRIKLNYQSIHSSTKKFKLTIENFQRNHGRGMNVTLPFKQLAYQFADDASPEAHKAKAASGLKFLDKKKTYAVNFDGLGLVNDLMNNHSITIENADILIIGAGGATQGILGPILAKKPKQILIANRTVAKAEKLVALFSDLGKLRSVTLSDILPKKYDIIIHTTSLGHQNQQISLPPELIGNNTCCYDISYGAAAHPFFNWASRQASKKIFDGLGMLVEHNAEIFNLWFGVKPQTYSVISYLRSKM